MLKVIPINKNITLNYIPMKKLKTTSLGMYIHRDLNREDASKNAILPHVLKKGNAIAKNQTEVAHFLGNLYGADFSAGISKKGDDHILCFDFSVISDKYAPNGEKLAKAIVKFMIATVFAPLDKFDETVFEQERKNSISKIENIINDKRVYANYRCQEEMTKKDKFSIARLGYKEDFEKLTAEELYGYYTKIRTSSKIDIYVCGDCDIEDIAEEIKSEIKDYTFSDAKMPQSEILKKDTPVNNIKERKNVTQGKLSMGFLTNTKPNDEDFFALVVANAIFGGGAQSKLFNNVREKLSLAYYAGSFIDKCKGIMMVNAGIEFVNFDKAYQEIMAQLDEMKKGNITELEFESSKGFLINSLNSHYDDQRAMISFFLSEKISNTSMDIDECIEKIKAVTKEDVVSYMSKVKLDTVYFLTGNAE